MRERARKSGTGVSAEDVILRVLRLGCGMNQEPAVIAKLLRPFKSPRLDFP
jgi:hypothetical protein